MLTLAQHRSGHRSGMLPQHLDFIFDISDALNEPALSSMWLYNSVSQSSYFHSANPSRSQFRSSSMTWQIQLVDGTLRIIGGWCGQFRYVRHLVACESLVLTFLISQQSWVDSFQVATCTAHCAVHFTSSITSQVTFFFALAPPIALDAFQHLLLIPMHS